MREMVAGEPLETGPSDGPDDGGPAETPRRRGVAGAMESLRSWFSKRFPSEPPLE